MRECKKIIFIILALLPCLVLIYNACVGVFSNSSFDFIPVGVISISDGVLTVPPDTWSDYLLTPLNLNSTGSVGLTPMVLDFIEWCNLNAGIPVNLPVLMAAFYNIYLAFLYILDLVFDIALFAIKKLSEVLR